MLCILNQHNYCFKKSFTLKFKFPTCASSENQQKIVGYLKIVDWYK